MDEATPNIPMDDVRMRGFARRTGVEGVIAWIDRTARRLKREEIDLAEGAGRVLAEDVASAVDVPSFDRAMMDGYAVRSGDVQGAGAYQPLTLKVIGESLPGRPFGGVVAAGQAVRIMTGAPMPDGADAVLPAEQVEAEGERIAALGDVSPGKHVGRRGEDVRQGATILRSLRMLRPQDVGLLASIGAERIQVVARPRVCIATTGNELAPAGSRPSAYCIADANGPMLEALVKRDGGTSLRLPPVEDRPEAILQAMETDSDLTLVSGGSSVGAEDFAPRVLSERGELAIHGIAMRPSSPTGMGTLDGRIVVLLPGNPVSCLCAYDFFAGRAIRLLGGRSPDWPYRRLAAELTRKISSPLGRVDYVRVRFALDAGTDEPRRVEPLGASGASILSSTTEADGFVLVAENSEGFAAGARVEVFLYDGA